MSAFSSSLQTQRIDLEPRHSRLVVLGDPHGALKTVQRVLSLDRDDRTLATCVGDVVGYADGVASSSLAEYLHAERIPTVEGNHEDWVRDDGTLAIVQNRDAGRRLTSETLDWMRTLPAHIEFRRAGTEDLLALMVHSIRRPDWDWLGSTNAAAFVQRLGNPNLVLSGHSHRPKFIVVTPGYGTFIEPFDFEANDEIGMDIPEEGSVLVDAGSLGRAELEPSLKTPGVRSGPSRYGTYAVVDFEQRRVVLRRIVRLDAH